MSRFEYRNVHTVAQLHDLVNRGATKSYLYWDAVYINYKKNRSWVHLYNAYIALKEIDVYMCLYSGTDPHLLLALNAELVEMEKTFIKDLTTEKYKKDLLIRMSIYYSVIRQLVKLLAE